MIALLVAFAEPVPAALDVGTPRLRGIGNDDPELFRRLIHARAGGEILRRLFAAVQHHHQRQRLSAVHAGQVQHVEARPGAADENAPSETARPRSTPEEKPGAKSHCFSMWRNAITSRHFAISRAMKAFISSGLDAAGSPPKSMKRWCVSGWASALRTSAFNRSTTGRGVPPLAPRPTNEFTS